MPPDTPTVNCPHCNTAISAEGIGLYERIVCPSCMRPFFANTRLGAYELLSELGVGGMSLVFKARDIVLGRELALKILNETYRNDPQRVARFERECALMAKVRHAHVARVYAAGKQNAYCYIAMELIDGSNVESEIGDYGAFDPAEALRIVRQVAEGLQAAHRAGLLHRDMKPANILLTSTREAKVVDFGLALLNSESDTEEMVWATPYYAAPETLMRKKEDARADIYSLGMTLRHMLTGRPPFVHGVTSIHALLTIKKKLPKLQEETPHLPTALCDLVDHMTAFSAWQRPRSYGKLLLEMEETAELVARAAEEKAALKLHTPTYQKNRRLRLAAMVGTATALLLAFLLPEACDTQKAASPVKATSKTRAAAPVIAEQRGDLLLRAEKAIEYGRLAEGADIFRELGRQTTWVVRAWCVLQAYNCMAILGDKNAFDQFLAADALSLAAVPMPASETTHCVFAFMHHAMIGKGKDFTPMPNSNDNLVASVELASGITQMYLGRAQSASTHLNHAAKIFTAAADSPYRGYLASITPLLTPLQQLAELQALPETTLQEKSEKAARITAYWAGEGQYAPYLCRAIYRQPMLDLAQQWKREADQNAPRDRVRQKLASGQYAEAAALFDGGNYPASASQRKVLSEMCGVAERFCRLVQLRLDKADLKALPNLTTLDNRTFAPAKALRFGQGSFWLADGNRVAVRELSAASLAKLYETLGGPSEARAAKSAEMHIVMDYLHGGEEGVQQKIDELRRKNDPRHENFLRLWEQWMEAAGAQDEKSASNR